LPGWAPAAARPRSRHRRRPTGPAAAAPRRCRTTLGLLGGEGYEAFAPDWLGHGDSDKPGKGAFAFSEAAYLAGLQGFVAAAGIRKPYALVVQVRRPASNGHSAAAKHSARPPLQQRRPTAPAGSPAQGFVLGQYGLLHALAHEADVARLLVLNTPLSLKAKLRPELAAYKSPLPFMRPGAKTFDAANFNAAGSPYAMQARDADVFARPYAESPAASAAVAETMEQVRGVGGGWVGGGWGWGWDSAAACRAHRLLPLQHACAHHAPPHPAAPSRAAAGLARPAAQGGRRLQELAQARWGAPTAWGAPACRCLPLLARKAVALRRPRLAASEAWCLRPPCSGHAVRQLRSLRRDRHCFRVPGEQAHQHEDRQRLGQGNCLL
jgi:hypothetical protein